MHEQSDRILWRISISCMSSDGPFSHFAGYDRILVLLEGAGLRLEHEDGTEHCLNSTFKPGVTIVSGGSKNVSINADVLAVYALDDSLQIVDPDKYSHPVQNGDLLLVDAPREGKWSFSGATAIVIQLSQNQAPN